LGDRRSEPCQSLKYGKHGKQEVKAIIVLLSHLPRASLSPQESDWWTLLWPTGQLGRAASKCHNKVCYFRERTFVSASGSSASGQ
jgi:hypothetical protein